MLRMERGKKSTSASVPPVDHSTRDVHKSVLVSEPNKHIREWGIQIKVVGRVRGRKNAPVTREIIRVVLPLVVQAESVQRSSSEFYYIINRLVYEYRTSEPKIANEADPKCPRIRE